MPSNEKEWDRVDFCRNLSAGMWIKTSDYVESHFKFQDNRFMFVSRSWVNPSEMEIFAERKKKKLPKTIVMCLFIVSGVGV